MTYLSSAAPTLYKALNGEYNSTGSFILTTFTTRGGQAISLYYKNS